MPSPSALATGISGVGLTVASAFVPALGLSVHQQRIGFAMGVLLTLLGVGIYLWQRQRATDSPRASIDTTAGTDASVVGYIAGRDVNVTTPEPPRSLPDPLAAARRELRDNRDKIAEALEEGRYPFKFFVSHSKEARADDALGPDPSLRKKLTDAYSGCKRLRRKIKNRGHAGVNGDLVQVIPEDELPEVISAIDAALTELDL